MKKNLLIVTIVLVFTLCLTGCGSKEVNKEAESKANDILNNNTSEKNTSDDNTTTDSKKMLIVYFSKTGENYNVGNIDVGNTAMMASYMKEYLNADSFEIVPVNKYSDDYEECKKEATKEMNENARPKIQNKVNNFDLYDTVFIGYPIWWGDMPMIVYTFMEEYDFTGKTVIPFNTHEGSGNAGTYSTIKSKLSGANVNTNGLALQGKIARTDSGKDQTINWLKGLGY